MNAKASWQDLANVTDRIGSMYYSYDGTGQRVQGISTYNTEKSQSTLK